MKVLSVNQISAIDVMIFLIISMNLGNTSTLNIKSAHYRCIISGIIKNEVINLMLNANLTKKRETL